MTNRVLVIGGTGLISSAIVRDLLRRRVEVTVLNRDQSTNRPLPSGVHRLTGDRRDADDFRTKLRAAGRFDAIIDMVCYDPADAAAMVHTCEGMAGHVIFCSTVDVYAKPDGPSRHPMQEDEPQCGMNDYGRNKVACERIFTDAAARGAFPVTILRPAHTYDDRGALIHSFGGGTAYLDRLRRGMPVIVHGDGTSLWCSAHADDVGPAFASAAGNPAAFGKAYNVTGQEFMTWNQMYRTTCQIKGWPPPKLVHIPSDLLARLMPERGNILLENFQHDNIFDNQSAAADLGFTYSITFQDAVRRVTAWLETSGRIEPAETQPWYDRLLESWKTHVAELCLPGEHVL